MFSANNLMSFSLKSHNDPPINIEDDTPVNQPGYETGDYDSIPADKVKDDNVPSRKEPGEAGSKQQNNFMSYETAVNYFGLLSFLNIMFIESVAYYEEDDEIRDELDDEYGDEDDDNSDENSDNN